MLGWELRFSTRAEDTLNHWVIPHTPPFKNMKYWLTMKQKWEVDERWRLDDKKRSNISVAKTQGRVHLSLTDRTRNTLFLTIVKYHEKHKNEPQIPRHYSPQGRTSKSVRLGSRWVNKFWTTPMSLSPLISMEMCSWNVLAACCWSYSITQLCKMAWIITNYTYPPTG